MITPSPDLNRYDDRAFEVIQRFSRAIYAAVRQAIDEQDQAETLEGWVATDEVIGAAVALDRALRRYNRLTNGNGVEVELRRGPDAQWDYLPVRTDSNPATFTVN